MAKQFVMNRDSWLKIRKIFEEAIELPAGARSNYLLQTCGEDTSLRKEVEKLLSSHRDDSYLEPPEEFTGNSLLENAARASSPPPDRVGRYRLLECIGSGGMGQIYRAVRDDREYEKEVAVKLIKRGMDTDEILRRFRTERQTLASLDHPNIARLLDGGTTRDGLPYLVMEYVNGVPIDKYCDREQLPIAARLRLFRQVCSAVEYAHRNLIVHRDIKPANILVTPEGIPKLLDFGIAKLLDNESSGMTVTTVSSMKMMTPRYASPEQIMCRPITTATDVYSLGVVLYELLTGRSPYSCDTQSRNSIERQIIQSDPERPSASVRRDTTDIEGETTVAGIEAVCASRNITRDKLRKLLKRDLDTIVMTALHKETERRYASVEQLSEDIRRYLGGLPIVAEADSLRYVASKFIGRHKSVVTVSVLAFLILVAGVIGTTTAMFRAQKAALVAENATDKANSELKKANEIRQFLQDMLAAADPENEGRDVTVREVLDQASKRVDSELGSEPVVCEAVHRTIGQTYFGLGLYEQARLHLEKAHELVESVYGMECMEYADSLNDLVPVLRKYANHDYSLKFFRKNRLFYGKKFGMDSFEVGMTYANHAKYLSDDHEYEKSIAEYRIAFSIFDKSGRKVPIETIRAFGVTLAFSGRLREAKSYLYRALKESQEAIQDDNVELANILHSLACLHDCEGRIDISESLFRDSLRIKLKILGLEHPDLAVTFLSIGDILYLKGDFSEAERFYEKAVESRKKSGMAGKIMVKQSLACMENLNFQDYALLWREARSNYYAWSRSGIWVRDALGSAWLFESLAELHSIHDRVYLAEDCLRTSLANAQAMTLKPPVSCYSLELISEIRRLLGIVLYQQGKYELAGYHFRETLVDRRERLWENHWLIGESLYYIGRIQKARLNPIAATLTLRESLRIFNETLPLNHRLIACAKSSLGQCLVSLGQFTEGKSLLEECIPNLEEVLGHRDLPTKLGMQKREAEWQMVAAIRSLIAACEATSDRQGADKWRKALKAWPEIVEKGPKEPVSRRVPFTFDWWNSV